MASAGAHRRRDGLRQQAAGKGKLTERGERARVARAGGMGGGRGRGRACKSNSILLWWRCLERGDVAYCNCGNCGGGNCGGTAASAASGCAALRESRLDGAAAARSGTGPSWARPAATGATAASPSFCERGAFQARMPNFSSKNRLKHGTVRSGSTLEIANVTLPSGPCRTMFTATTWCGTWVSILCGDGLAGVA